MKARYRFIGILIFSLLMFFIFLSLKLPEARIQNLVLAHIQIIAQEQGLLFNAEKVRIGIILGPSLKFYNAELRSINDEKQSLKLAYLKIRPHLFAALTALASIRLS